MDGNGGEGSEAFFGKGCAPGAGGGATPVFCFFVFYCFCVLIVLTERFLVPCGEEGTGLP